MNLPRAFAGLLIACMPALALGKSSTRAKPVADAWPQEFIVFVLLIAALFALFYLWTLVWVFRDSRRRGKSGLLVLFLAFWWWPMSLLVWLALRPNLPPPPPAPSRREPSFDLIDDIRAQ